MRLIKGSLVGLVMAGVLALAPTAAFAHGGGGGGHGGGGGWHGGGFGGARGHFAGFAGHSFAEHQGAHFARHGDHFRHDGDFFFGGPFSYGDTYSYDSPYYGDYNGYNDGAYYPRQYSPAEVTPSQKTIVAVQKELAKLGYYNGPLDGLIGPQTERAISWFQSIDQLSVSGQIDDPTLKALRIS